jgi:hypothetical protein
VKCKHRQVFADQYAKEGIGALFGWQKKEKSTFVVAVVVVRAWLNACLSS